MVEEFAAKRLQKAPNEMSDPHKLKLLTPKMLSLRQSFLSEGA